MPSKCCPKCKKVCGPRTLKCECGFDFFSTTGESTVKQQTGKFLFSTVGATIHAGAGRCPINYVPGMDLNNWITQMSQKANYTPNALKLYIRRIVPPDQVSSLCGQIDQLVGSSYNPLHNILPAGYRKAEVTNNE